MVVGFWRFLTFRIRKIKKIYIKKSIRKTAETHHRSENLPPHGGDSY